MFEASTSAIRYGRGVMRNRSQITSVTGATSRITVTLSSIGEAMAVISINMTISRNGLPRERFAAQMAKKSNNPVGLIIPTMIIIPRSKKMTFQSMPSCSE